MALRKADAEACFAFFDEYPRALRDALNSHPACVLSQVEPLRVRGIPDEVIIAALKREGKK